MSQRNRIVFAAIGLVVVLLVAAPATSHAAVLWEGSIPGASALERVWDWMTGFRLSGSPRKPAARWEKEGGMINPNGGTGIVAPVPPGDTVEEGGMINPNGVR